jgi:hypothetical protein
VAEARHSGRRSAGRRSYRAAPSTHTDSRVVGVFRSRAENQGGIGAHLATTDMTTRKTDAGPKASQKTKIPFQANGPERKKHARTSGTNANATHRFRYATHLGKVIARSVNTAVPIARF